MITGQLKSQIDQIWNTFWPGGISNTIKKLTYNNPTMKDKFNNLKE